jgi:hypothetical protein
MCPRHIAAIRNHFDVFLADYGTDSAQEVPALARLTFAIVNIASGINYVKSTAEP